MRWLVGIIIVLIVILAGWYIFSTANAPATTQVATSTTPTSTVEADILPNVPNDTYYSEPNLSFSIDYPQTATTTSDFSSGYLPLTQTPVIAIELPQSMFAGTNLTEAGVYIGATTTPTVMSACTEPAQGETATTSETVGGQDFSVFTSTGAAAGNIYQEKTLRTYQNGSCLEIVELLHSGDIGNYTAGSVQPFNQAQFSGILDSIVATYYPIPTGE